MGHLTKTREIVRYSAELEVANREAFDTSSLRTGIMAGAPCPAELIDAVMQDLGARETEPAGH